MKSEHPSGEARVPSSRCEAFASTANTAMQGHTQARRKSNHFVLAVAWTSSQNNGVHPKTYKGAMVKTPCIQPSIPAAGTVYSP